MALGPYRVRGQRLEYSGNKASPSLLEVRGVAPPPLHDRHVQLRVQPNHFGALMKIWDAVSSATAAFMRREQALLFDLPITTRMISSPGALTGTIPSDVDPFEINFFQITLVELTPLNANIFGGFRTALSARSLPGTSRRRLPRPRRYSMPAAAPAGGSWTFRTSINAILSSMISPKTCSPKRRRILLRQT